MMLEIKLRIRAIDDCLSNAKKQLAPLDVEFCFLQVRKIVEQICFASILCDKTRYKEFRELEGATDDNDHGNYEQDWNSRIILNKLKDISPHFMPIPLGQRHSVNNEHNFEVADVNVTHNKLIKIYRTCGSYLHIPKPYGEDYEVHVSKQRQKYKTATDTIQGYAEYLKSLLWNHAAIGLEYAEGGDPLQPASPKNAWLVDFGDSSSDQISITVAVAK